MQLENHELRKCILTKRFSCVFAKDEIEYGHFSNSVALGANESNLHSHELTYPTKSQLFAGVLSHNLRLFKDCDQIIDLSFNQNGMK